MGEGALLIAFITLQRLAELIVAARHTARLRAEGAVEFGHAHYPLMVGFHAAWICGLLWFGAGRTVEPHFLGLFLVLLALRIWVIASLGRHWTTRIIVLPGAKLVRRGPYRWLRHPNYLVVALEIAVVPLALGLRCSPLSFRCSTFLCCCTAPRSKPRRWRGPPRTIKPAKPPQQRRSLAAEAQADRARAPSIMSTVFRMP